MRCLSDAERIRLCANNSEVTSLLQPCQPPGEIRDYLF
jgi:hypothetical protein